MKAIVCTNYGSPDVFQLQEVNTPIPKDHEVRIKIHAASVGRADCTFRKGSPIVRLVYGLKRPRNQIFGTELSGEIDAVGKEVTRYQVGDQVFGLSAKTFGAQANTNVCTKTPRLRSNRPRCPMKKPSPSVMVHLPH